MDQTMKALPCDCHFFMILITDTYKNKYFSQLIHFVAILNSSSDLAIWIGKICQLSHRYPKNIFKIQFEVR
jgi:hypothetical protein